MKTTRRFEDAAQRAGETQRLTQIERLLREQGRRKEAEEAHADLVLHLGYDPDEDNA